jgi:glycosyltransferase involved in cell wall biosynthesis
MHTTNKPLVSIVMIFLNAEKFIKEAIESVRAQSYDAWELLLVDDGSKDASSSIARDYAAASQGRIRYLEHEGHANHGMSNSRNLGIANALGTYIAFLDADDAYKPGKLSAQVSIMVAMVYGSPVVWRSWNTTSGSASRDSRRKLGVKTDVIHEPPELFGKFLDRTADTPATCSVLLRADAVKAVGGWEDSFRGMFEDQAFFAKICLKYPVFVESGCWDYYRQHDESCCNEATGAGEYRKMPPSPAHKTYVEWLEKYLRDAGTRDQRVWDAFSAARLPYEHPLLFQVMLLPEKTKIRVLKFAREVTPPTVWNAVRDRFFPHGENR